MIPTRMNARLILSLTLSLSLSLLSARCGVLGLSSSSTTGDATRTLMPPKNFRSRTPSPESLSGDISAAGSGTVPSPLSSPPLRPKRPRIIRDSGSALDSSSAATSFSAPDSSFSLEKGILYVRQLARDLTPQSLSTTASHLEAVPEDSSAISYADLVQEGYVALVQAVNAYQQNSKGKGSMGHYVHRQIHLAMTRTLETTDSRPIGLPHRVARILQKAKELREQQSDTKESTPSGTVGTGAASSSIPTSSSQTTPTNVSTDNDRTDSATAIAKALGISPRELEQYETASHGTLSIESTLEISDDQYETVRFQDRVDWESRHGDDDVRSYYTLESNADSDDYEAATAESLPDVIADTNQPSPGDAVLESMLQTGMRALLHETLTREEDKIVRMLYGIDEMTTRTIPELAMMLGVPRRRLQQIEQSAMSKLRQAFEQRYAETYSDGEYQDIEDSV